MITRQDLSPAQQAVQGMHAAVGYASKHEFGDTLIFLAASSEAHLEHLRSLLCTYDYTCVSFHEPDLGNQLTALAVESAAGRRLAHLPLALRGGEKNGRE